MGKDEELIANAKITGIGPKAQETLAQNSITTVAQLAIMRPEELQAILGLTLAKSKEAINSAKDKALTTVVEMKTAQEVADERTSKVKYISTGSNEFNRILTFKDLTGKNTGGGIPTDTITMFSGHNATGKTEMCLQLIVNCIKDFGRKGIFIETEPSTFIPERLMEIANSRGIKIDLSKDIMVIQAHSVPDPFKQFLAYEVVNKKLESGFDAGVLAIDSFVAKFRQFYTGREQLPNRAQEWARHFGFLEMLTSKYNLATILTDQVGGIPDQGAQLGAKMRFGMDKSPYGGEFVAHSVGNFISLTKAKTEVWNATIADSSYLARTSAYFKITSKGVEDLEQKDLDAMKR